MPRGRRRPGRTAPQRLDLPLQQPRNAFHAKLLPLARIVVARSEHPRHQRPSRPRVNDPGEDDVGGELQPGAIGANPDAGKQFVDDPWAADVVGNEERIAVVAANLEPFAALAGVGLSADAPLL